MHEHLRPPVREQWQDVTQVRFSASNEPASAKLGVLGRRGGAAKRSDSFGLAWAGGEHLETNLPNIRTKRGGAYPGVIAVAD